MRVALFAAPLVAAVSPVGKVIQLLGELKAKVQKDLDAEAAAMEEFTEFCDDEITEKGFAIKTAASKIEEYAAAIEEATGKVSGYSTSIEDGGATQAAKAAELADAQAVRAQDAKDFAAAEKELVETVDTLARAGAVLKRELSFAQGGSVSKKLGSMVNALQAIVAAQDTSSSKVVKAFLEDDDLSLAQQPQASTSNYESKSGGIVDAVKDMEDKADSELQSLRKTEMKNKHNFAMLEQSLNDALANLKKELAEATANKSSTEEAKAQAEEDLSKTEASKAADEEYRKNMQQECQTTAVEWEERQRSAAGEMEALAKAKEILGGGAALVQTSLMQTSTHTKRSKAIAMDDNRAALVSVLKKMGRKFNSFALMQMAGHAKSDPFVKVRGMVEEMISKLEKEAQEEATQEAFCQEEKAKSSKARETKSASVDKYQARIDKAKATSEQLKQEVGQLQKEIAKTQASLGKATQIRATEKRDNKVAAEDFAGAAEAVTQAMAVLREFYGGAALIQQPAGSRSDAAGGIISFLEVAQSDFTRLQAEVEAAEAESKSAFAKLSQESAVTLATKGAEVKGKNSEIKSLGVAINNTGSDLENSSKELDAIMEYIEKLKPQCESKAMSYAERKAARDAEIAGLKEAMTILEGEAPAELALMQKKAFLSRN